VKETFCCYEDDSKEWEGTKKNGRREKKPSSLLGKQKIKDKMPGLRRPQKLSSSYAVLWRETEINIRDES
jgi:hypothetical protein